MDSKIFFNAFKSINNVCTTGATYTDELKPKYEEKLQELINFEANDNTQIINNVLKMHLEEIHTIKDVAQWDTMTTS